MTVKTKPQMTALENANLPAAFFAMAAAHPDLDLLASKCDGIWQKMTYGEVANQVRQLAEALIRHGISAGDKVFIAAENRPEWAIADLAVMAIGGIAVPSFITNTEDDFAYIMDHSESVMAITFWWKFGAICLERCWNGWGENRHGHDRRKPDPACQRHLA